MVRPSDFEFGAAASCDRPLPSECCLWLCPGAHAEDQELEYEELFWDVECSSSDLSAPATSIPFCNGSRILLPQPF